MKELEEDRLQLLKMYVEEKLMAEVVTVALAENGDAISPEFGHVKMPYRGLAKNTAQRHTIVALSNLWMVRLPLGGVQT